jgi:hypothetical protein
VTGLQSMHPGPVTIPAQRYTLALWNRCFCFIRHFLKCFMPSTFWLMSLYSHFFSNVIVKNLIYFHLCKGNVTALLCAWKESTVLEQLFPCRTGRKTPSADSIHA